MVANPFHDAQDDVADFAMSHDFKAPQCGGWKCNQGRGDCTCQFTSEFIPEPDRHEDEDQEPISEAYFWCTLAVSILLFLIAFAIGYQ